MEELRKNSPIHYPPLPPAIILSVILLNSFGNTTLQVEGLGIPSIQGFGLSSMSQENLTFITSRNWQSIFPLPLKSGSVKERSLLNHIYGFMLRTKQPIYWLVTYFVIPFITKGILDVRHWITPESFFWGRGGFGKDTVMREKLHSFGVLTPILQLHFFSFSFSPFLVLSILLFISLCTLS